MKLNIRIVVLLGAFCLLVAAPAYAYVDPGTGSVILQFVTGGIAGLLILLRLYWRRLKGLFSRNRGAERPARPSEASSSPDDLK